MYNAELTWHVFVTSFSTMYFNFAIVLIKYNRKQEKVEKKGKPSCFILQNFGDFGVVQTKFEA